MPVRTESAALVAFGLGLIFAPGALGGRYDFITIDYPGAVATRVYGINDAGDMAGNIDLPGGTTRCFVLKGGEFTLPAIPGATSSRCCGLNDSGDVGGGYTSADGREHGFILSGGRLTTLDYPGYELTRVVGINNKGDAVGMQWNATGDTRHRGFVYSGGRFTFIEYPESDRMTCLFGINDEGDAVGHWSDKAGVRHGLVWSKGKLTSFDLPAALETMIDMGMITSAGDIVGPYQDLRGKSRGFLLRKGGALTRVEVPGATATLVYRINKAGELVGSYRDAAGIQHGLLMKPAPAVPQILTVDDDGADCPGSLRTIQEAVERARAGATIQVCPGTYRHTVEIKGQAKNGLSLIALGREGEVVLEGDYTEPNGFLLQDVQGVLVRGFTVKDFGNQPTGADQWGSGFNIALRNASYSTIENNQLLDGDMVGIFLFDSANNTVRNNTSFVTNSALANCGIHIGGAKAAGNFIANNLLVGNNMSGIMLDGAGPDNIVVNNAVLSNGRYGITNNASDGTRIEGNRASFNRGAWGSTPFAKEPGIGIDIRNSTKVTVIDNRARNNTGVDVHWDGKGDNKFDANACETSTVGACLMK